MTSAALSQAACNSAFILQIAAKIMIKVIMEPSPRNRVGSYCDVTTSAYAHHLSHFCVATNQSRENP